MAKRADIFQSIPVGKIGRSNFNLSHQVTGNFREGICYPVFCEETLPGDTWRINTYNITKLETLLSPVMQRTNASLIWIKVAKRLCMKNFKKWYSGGQDGYATNEKPYFRLTSFCSWLNGLIPSVPLSSNDIEIITNYFFGPGSLWQCLGLPIPYVPDGTTGINTFVPPFINNVMNWNTKTINEKIDLIPFIAYAKIYDEYFMDQSLSQPVFVQDEDYGDFNINWSKTLQLDGHSITLISSGLNVYEGGEFDFKDIIPLFCLFRRAWSKDYYTSAMPTPQRGPEVSLDIFSGQSAPVTIDEQSIHITGDGRDNLLFDMERPVQEASTIIANGQYGLEENQTELYAAKTGYTNNYVTGITGKSSELSGSADLSGLSPISIVAFRNLFKLQAFLEKNNIAGGRFIEFILAHWAERVPDFTVQRPVFVRATKIPVLVSEVTATANSDGLISVVGDQAGRAKGQGNLGRCSIYTQEPSIIIGLYCVTPPPSYVNQGIPKKFQRMTRWDEPYVEFQHIGEQAILEKEIFIPWRRLDDTDPEAEFGYQQRYSEYKYLPDRVIGEFATSLSYWHQARMFTAAPRLNQSFIENDPSERIFAVENQNPVISDFWFDINCSRKLSKFSTPKLN